MNLAAPSPAVSDQAQNSVLKRRVALQSMLAACCMTALKLAAGLISGSLGVLSDAAHSGLESPRSRTVSGSIVPKFTA